MHDDLRVLEEYLHRLRDLPFVEEAELQAMEPEVQAARADALLLLRTPRRAHRFFVELKRTNLTYAIADGVIARMQGVKKHRWILFAPYVPPPMGRYLAERGMNFVDAVGNCHLEIGQDHIAAIEGRKPVRRKGRGRGIGVAGHQVLFAILARPELLDAPVRKLAEEAGVGKTAVADTLNRLTREGLVGAGKPRRLLAPGQVLDRWLASYDTLVRPRLMIGRYRTADLDPTDLEKRVEAMLADEPRWAWGGGAAAMRLTGYYRGEDTVLHVRTAGRLGAIDRDLRERLRALPAQDGPLTILRAPGNVAFEGARPRTVHPLLIYTELYTAGNERAREAAREVRKLYLEQLP